MCKPKLDLGGAGKALALGSRLEGVAVASACLPPLSSGLFRRGLREGGLRKAAEVGERVFRTTAACPLITFGCTQAASATQTGVVEEVVSMGRSSFWYLFMQRLRKHLLPAAAKAPSLLEALVMQVPPKASGLSVAAGLGNCSFWPLPEKRQKTAPCCLLPLAFLGTCNASTTGLKHCSIAFYAVTLFHSF